MKINIKYFASVRETLASDGEVLHLTHPQPTIADAIAALKNLSPNHAQALSHPRLSAALNLTMSQLTTALNDGDELALFPPVTGG